MPQGRLAQFGLHHGRDGWGAGLALLRMCHTSERYWIWVPLKLPDLHHTTGLQIPPPAVLLTMLTEDLRFRWPSYLQSTQCLFRI